MKAYPKDVIQPIGIGYWKSEHEPDLPAPQDHIDLSIPAAQREAMIQYLDNGLAYIRFLGISFCRFGCCYPGTDMGSADLTDGTYVWPEGLSHYIKGHGVWLPLDFVEHTISNAGSDKTSIDLKKLGHRDLTWWTSISPGK